MPMAEIKPIQHICKQLNKHPIALFLFCKNASPRFQKFATTAHKSNQELWDIIISTEC